MKTAERNERLTNAYKQISRIHGVFDILYSENQKNPVPSKEYEAIHTNLINAIANLQVVLMESIKVEDDLGAILRTDMKKAQKEFRG